MMCRKLSCDDAISLLHMKLQTCKENDKIDSFIIKNTDYFFFVLLRHLTKSRPRFFFSSLIQKQWYREEKDHKGKFSKQQNSARTKIFVLIFFVVFLVEVKVRSTF